MHTKRNSAEWEGHGIVITKNGGKALRLPGAAQTNSKGKRYWKLGRFAMAESDWAVSQTSSGHGKDIETKVHPSFGTVFKARSPNDKKGHTKGCPRLGCVPTIPTTGCTDQGGRGAEGVPLVAVESRMHLRRGIWVEALP